MSSIRIAWGTGTAPTEMAAYDAALADANLHNYNLVTVSSVIPADVPVEVVGTAPDLGPAGNRLTVVEAHASVAGPSRASAGLAWSRSEGTGPGLFYEASGETDADEIADVVRTGLDAGRDLRDWAFAGEQVETATVTAGAGEYASAVVLAAYGDSTPLC
ncbi:pyruvoyl-dependent arginine decarboxylase [Salarchaeum sp. JOR-1]|uniref:pyruvoyl-dependent arginine decarboxylase n=1 Tax=Salarchaeum sp. JOR-1 TaxID=2599399 RepID=UPI001198775B|nr:pyruvoyl-dependent arginine decarboxylase [Salarchaeum sp. JOR-1]QDX40496.1 pyruvoyl-dependent arginine decarboxylase subunit alpha [Salarchaeum sp. JOR-1]